MVARIPDTLVPGGTGFALARQSDVAGGLHSLSRLANLEAELPASRRVAGMVIGTRDTGRLYMLGSDLVTLTEVTPAIGTEALDAAVALASGAAGAAAGSAGAAAAAVANAQAAARALATFAALQALAGTVDGEGAEVLDSDTGTHGAASASGYDGAAVANAGRYSWVAAWARWQRIGATGLSSRATVAALDARLARDLPKRYLDGRRLLGWVESAAGRLAAGWELDGTTVLHRLRLRRDAEMAGNLAVSGTANLATASVAGQLALPGLRLMPVALQGYLRGQRVALPVCDGSGRTALAVLADGSVYVHRLRVDAHDIALPLPQGLPLLSEVVLWGDSLTAGTGGGGTTIGTALAGATGRVVRNMGIGGQSSNQIAARMGARVLRVRLAEARLVAGANVLTHVEGVALAGMAATPAADQLLATAADNTARTLRVEIEGVAGTLARSATGGPPSTGEALSFTPDAGAVLPACCPTEVALRVTGAAEDSRRIAILWAGRNNYADPDRVMADLEAMVRLLTEAGNRRFVILGILNGNYAAEAAGGANYATLTALNTRILQRWPLNAIDIRRWLIDRGLATAGLTPTTQDLADIAADVVPAALRADNIHLNAAGYALIGGTVLPAFLQAKGWT